MKILVLGADGYLGWPISMHLALSGHTIACLDNMIKRQWEHLVGVKPLCRVELLSTKIDLWNSTQDNKLKMYHCDMTNRHYLYRVMDQFMPDAVVHLAEQPSAPYSMIDAESCLETQSNNILGTLNLIHAVAHLRATRGIDCHIVKLGTMGEYGTPNIDIEEGWIDIEHNGRHDRLPFPKQPGSWYHASKVCDSVNLEFAARCWGLRITDLNQGVVYGVNTEGTALRPEFGTSFHYDAIFGTVINRFILQAICGTPLTVYGKGAQKRGFIDINDTLECIKIACENPPLSGAFRVFNQMTQFYSIEGLADAIMQTLGGTIQEVPNPRVEAENHYYNPKHTALEELGLKPRLITREVIESIASWVEGYKEFADKRHIMPEIQWRQADAL